MDAPGCMGGAGGKHLIDGPDHRGGGRGGTSTVALWDGGGGGGAWAPLFIGCCRGGVSDIALLEIEFDEAPYEGNGGGGGGGGGATDFGGDNRRRYVSVTGVTEVSVSSFAKWRKSETARRARAAGELLYLISGCDVQYTLVA